MQTTEPVALSNLSYAVVVLVAELIALQVHLGPRLDQFEQTRLGPPDEHKDLLRLTAGSPRWELKREGQTKELLHLTKTQLDECADFTRRVQNFLGVGENRLPDNTPTLLNKLRTHVIWSGGSTDAQPLRWLRDRGEKTFADALYDVALLAAALLEFLHTAEMDTEYDEQGANRLAAAHLFRSLCDAIDLG